MLFSMSRGPHQLSPSWIGVCTAATIRAWPAESSARVGLLDPGERLAIEDADAFDRLLDG